MKAKKLLIKRRNGNMKLLKSLALMGVLFTPISAIAQITQQQVLNTIAADLPTNNANQISALLLRNVLNLMTSAIFEGVPIQSSGVCPPVTGLTTYQLYANTVSAPTGTTINVFDGLQCVPFLKLNQTAHTTGALLNGPSVFSNTVNVNSSLSANRYTQGTNLSLAASASFFDMEPNVALPGATFGTNSWYFGELWTAGLTTTDPNAFHNAFVINAVKQATVNVPNPGGNALAFTANQFCGGANNSSFCTGALLETNFIYNPFGQNGGRGFGGNSQVVVPSVATAGGVITPAEAASHEFDLFCFQPCTIKEGIRIVDLSSAAGTLTDANNSGYIRIAKGDTAPGMPYGIVFSSNYNAGFTDAGFPISTGGAAIFLSAPTAQLYAILDGSALGGGCTIACALLPANNPGVWFGAAGGGGKINSSTTSSTGIMTFATNGITFQGPDSGATGYAGIFQNAATSQIASFRDDGQVFNFGPLVLGVAGSQVGSIKFSNATSGTLTLQPTTGALTGTLTLPNVTDTVVTLAATQTLSNKTYATPVFTGIQTGPNLTLTSAAPTVAAAQIGYGSTTVAAGSGNCPTGTVGGKTVAGCIVFNVAGSTAVVPYF